MGDLSASPNGKFLGIIQRDKAFLRSPKPYKIDENGLLSTKVETFSDWQIPEQAISKFIFSQNSERFAVITGDTVVVRDTTTQGNLKSFPLSTESDKVSLNSDGTQLIVKDETLPENCDLELNCAISSNRKWMALSNNSDSVQIINLKTKKLVSVSKKLNIDPEKSALSNDGKLLAVSSRENVYVYRTDTWLKIGNFPHEWSLGEINFTTDDKWLVTITRRVSMDAAVLGESILVGSVIRVWNLESSQLVMNVSLAKEGGIISSAFNSDGKILITKTPVYSDEADNTNKVKGRVWILVPDELIKLGCSLLTRNLSDSEWSSFIIKRDKQERKTCIGLPVPQE